MHRDTFGTLAVVAFGLVVVSFVVMGTSRLLVSADTARLLSAPTMLTAAGLVVFLTVRSVLAVSGISPFEE